MNKDDAELLTSSSVAVRAAVSELQKNGLIPASADFSSLQFKLSKNPRVQGLYSTSGVLEAAHRFTGETAEERHAAVSLAEKWTTLILDTVETDLVAPAVSPPPAQGLVARHANSKLRLASTAPGYINIIEGDTGPLLRSSADKRKTPANLPITQLAVIGVIHSCFKTKYAIPRQGSLVPSSRGIVELSPSLTSSYLEGLQDFSHCWLVWLFHQAPPQLLHSTVRPPKLRGARKGVFSTRSPHRPSPIGLSVVKIESLQGRRLVVSGLDILDQTPLLDIKPYHPMDCLKTATYASWIPVGPPPLQVEITPEARKTLDTIVQNHRITARSYRTVQCGGIQPFQFFKEPDDFLQAVFEALAQDPRTTQQFVDDLSEKPNVFFLDNFEVYYTVTQNIAHIYDVKYKRKATSIPKNST